MENGLATIFKHPALPDYFQAVPGVSTQTPLPDIPSIVPAYEAGKVLTFPDLRFDIDFDFWESVPTDQYPELKKLGSIATPDRNGVDTALDKHFTRGGIPLALQEAIRPQIRKFYDVALPIYDRLFSGYSFTARRSAWRLNLIHNEDMHTDTYADEYPQHFARMFINLDRQPRIWQTSWAVDDMIQRFGDRIPRDRLATSSRANVWKEIKNAAFGPTAQWWDDQPRHVLYFDPGEAWIVDSRQVSHQIFYGRRAVSIDFWVDPASMQNPDRHYLNITDAFRERTLGFKVA
jgi:hypothetical protein